MKMQFSYIFLLLSLQAFNQDTLVKEDIQHAAKLADVNFSGVELDSMYQGVKDNLIEYRKMHQLFLNNSVPMSLCQSPVLPGMKFDMAQENIKWQIPKNVKIPDNKNELAFYSILELASLIKNKKLSSLE